jgi:hypothetical protein
MTRFAIPGALAFAFVIIDAPCARAAEHASPDIVRDDATASLDMGAGVMQPNLGQSLFTSLDTWNGQHTYYHATGSALGFAHPMGWIINVTAHAYPFSFRGFGFVATAEFGTFTGNTTSGASSFGPVDATNNSYWSVIGGPEAQFRVGSFFARAGLLGGGRYTQIDDFTAFEWRVALRGQVDWIIGDERRGGTAFTVGLFGGADVFPALGWSSGMSLSVAFM